jgi:hypothetical protein
VLKVETASWLSGRPLLAWSRGPERLAQLVRPGEVGLDERPVAGEARAASPRARRRREPFALVLAVGGVHEPLMIVSGSAAFGTAYRGMDTGIVLTVVCFRLDT